MIPLRRPPSPPVDSAIARAIEGPIDRLEALFDGHGALLGWLGTGSLVFFVGSLLALPWLVRRLPVDYFTAKGQARQRRERIERTSQPALRYALAVLRNVVGLVVFFAGVLMLVLPGQGILAMLLGLILMDYPGKHRFERYLVTKRAVHRPLNWLRRRAQQPPLLFGEDPASEGPEGGASESSE